MAGLRSISIAALLGIAPAAAAGQAAPAGLPSDSAHPYFQLVRQALARYPPAVLRSGVGGDVAYLYLLSDATGRITRTAVDSSAPRAAALTAIIRERWPDVDADSLARVARA